MAVRTTGDPDPDGRCVVYWMQRAQRAVDNPALDVAGRLGNELRLPVVVFFGLNPFITRANRRHSRFLVDGLPDIAAGLRCRRAGFVLRRYPQHRLLPFAADVRPAVVIGDENPLRHEFLITPKAPVARVRWRAPRGVTSLEPSPRLLDGLPIDTSLAAIAPIRGGTTEARRRLRAFVRLHLHGYDRDRNHPETSGTSQLSPYLHFGHVGPREVGVAVRDSGGAPDAVAAFLEQLIVRRELAVNFVTFNDRYDRLDGCERWARHTSAAHKRDRRPYRYAEARLDGRDPNGYANIAWAIGGKHDRPWPPRPMYGTVRSMSYASTVRKFDADDYIAQMNQI